MSRAVKTRAELVAEINSARAELLEAEDAGYYDDAVKARARVDDALDLLWVMIPAPRETP